MAAAMASPWPVLPEVGSTIVPPGLRKPARSAASIIRRPIRSLTLPPGLSISSLARIVGWTPRVILCRRTIGVSPTASRNVSRTSIAGSCRAATRPLLSHYAGGVLPAADGVDDLLGWASLEDVVDGAGPEHLQDAAAIVV